MEETGKQQREKMLLQAAFDGNLCLLRKMARGLDTGQGEAAVVAAVADSGSRNRTLHLAATEGRMDVCRYLIEDLCLDVNQPNDRGEAPLFLSAFFGRASATRYFLIMVVASFQHTTTVEGNYSMEGERCKLREIIAVCKKYKAYTYLDEVHSIGAVGKTGRGVCELLRVDPADVDIMMGTFTKSFGSCGRYIAASKEIIHHLKHTCPAHIYATSMSPPAVQQVISVIKVILREDGSNRGISERN